jgi:hypothetical protein
MTIHTIVLGVFTVALVFNAWALLRYWQAMRALKFVMLNFVESNRQFSEAMDAIEKREQANPITIAQGDADDR